MIELLLKALSTNGPRRLTGEAAFCAALFAGVPIISKSCCRESVTLETEYPVDVWIIDGSIRVFSKPN